jgi:glycosyltransferase involved in cell wall biosynthesis
VTRFLTAVPRSGILHGHSWLTSHPDFVALRGYVGLLRAKRCRWVETLHSGSLPDRFAGWSSKERRSYTRSLARAARLIAVSGPLREFLIEIGLPRERIELIGPLLPAAIELEPGAPDATTARFIETHDPTIVAVGAMLPTYDYVTVGEVFARLRRTHPDAGLIMVSTGSAIDHAYRSAVRAALDPSRAYILERQDVPRDELLGIMARASVMLRAFRSESYGLSRVEALLLGTPVVATTVGEQHGVVPYAVGDADSLEAALEVALASPRPDAARLKDHYARIAGDNLDSIATVYASCG